jgi:hypothetical protein
MANCSYIAGWSWNSSRPHAVLEIEIIVDDIPFQKIKAQGHREDLVKGGIGSGNYGFVIVTPDRLKDGQPHTVRARVSGSSVELKKSPTTLLCPLSKPVAPTGNTTR